MEEATASHANEGHNRSDTCDDAKGKRCLRKRRNWTNYGFLEFTSDEETNCTDAKDFKQVLLRWQPEQSCRPLIEEAPAFYPTEEEFEDTLSYIESIREKVEPYGICRIVPPPSWHPPSLLEEKSLWQNAKFVTRVQQVNKLQNRDLVRKRFRIRRKKKHRRWSRSGMTRRRNSHVISDLVDDGVASDADEKFGFLPGPEFTLESFQKYANDFQKQYFGNKDATTSVSNEQTDKSWKPSVEDIEGEYWRIVEKATEDIEVFYGADLETGVFGSGFPKRCNLNGCESDHYVTSGWNLNNFPRLPGSVLCFEQGDISGVVVPWIYIGMCFSSFCWHVEDHHLYSLNYHHFGEPKVWYGVPGSGAENLEIAMKKHLPALFERQPNLLNELVTQLSPSILRNEGVPVYRAVQKCGEFVLTFPRAYHSGFNCGFNCAEAVNVAPVDWLPHGQTAVELYSKQRRKTSVSHDKLLLGASQRAVGALSEIQLLGRSDPDTGRWKDLCGKETTLTRALKARVEIEKERRKPLLPHMEIIKMDKNFDLACEKECFLCCYDLHMSAAGCRCSPDRFACLNHSNLLCSCDYMQRYILIRYDMDQLETLVKALECDLLSILKWASEITDNKKTEKKDEERQSEEIIGNREHQTFTPSFDLSIGNDSYGRSRNIQEIKFPEMSLSCSSDYVDIPVVVELNSKRKFSTFESGVTVEGGRDSMTISTKKQVVMKSEEVYLTDKNRVDREGNLDLGLEEPSQSLICEFLGPIKLEKVPVVDVPTLADSSHSGKSHIEFDSVARCSDGASCSRDSKRPLTSAGTMLFGVDLNEIEAGNKGINKDKTPDMFEYCIEPLSFGTVVLGKRWCSKETIFPKGYRSRVKFLSILNPTQVCSYICEVLDGGPLGPLFKVAVEESPGEAFIHITASECWQMVLERLNQVCSRQHARGKQRSSLLQPPHKLDGLKMFGFLSSSIIQAIEALDPFHHCLEYWDSKSAPCSDKVGSSENVHTLHKDVVERYPCNGYSSSGETYSSNEVLKQELNESESEQTSLKEVRATLKGLFRKASHKELNMMHRVLCSESGSISWRVALATVLENIQRDVNK